MSNSSELHLCLAVTKGPNLCSTGVASGGQREPESTPPSTRLPHPASQARGRTGEPDLQSLPSPHCQRRPAKTQNIQMQLKSHLSDQEPETPNLDRKRQSTGANTRADAGTARGRFQRSHQSSNAPRGQDTHSTNESRRAQRRCWNRKRSDALLQPTSRGLSGLAAALGLALGVLFLRLVFPGGDGSGDRSGLFSTERRAGLPVGVDSNSWHRLPFGKT